jgi:hypothetical protein
MLSSRLILGLENAEIFTSFSIPRYPPRQAALEIPFAAKRVMIMRQEENVR